jgi:hypothetical protein
MKAQIILEELVKRVNGRPSAKISPEAAAVYFAILNFGLIGSATRWQPKNSQDIYDKYKECQSKDLAAEVQYWLKKFEKRDPASMTMLWQNNLDFGPTVEEINHKQPNL